MTLERTFEWVITAMTPEFTLLAKQQFDEGKMSKPIMHGLWRDDPKTPEGKYLVKRRDGTVVEWPNFTIGARDPAAPAALRAYATAAERFGMTAGYAVSVRKLADEFVVTPTGGSIARTTLRPSRR